MNGSNVIYPVGVQSFEKLRKSGCVYVDKTRFVWQLVTQPSPIFLSRPRRFGKSLLLSTIEAYFLGKKELFEGLAIYDCEADWEVYPVLHFDMNSEAYSSIGDLRQIIDDHLSLFESKYGVASPDGVTQPTRFRQLIRSVQAVTKRNVVVLFDEYDKPLLNTIDNKKLQQDVADELKAFYGVVKSLDAYIRFAMFTGVARFSKVSVFSDLNNLYDISLSSDFNSICGISESELVENFRIPIAELAESYGVGYDEMLSVLKKKYDGYNFSNPQRTECLYNPFSLLNCLREGRIDDYWFDTGTPSYLVKMLIHDEQDLPALYDDVVVDSDIMKGVNTPENSPITSLYQTGYLTVKAFDLKRNRYTLGFPNQEVTNGFNKLAFQVYGSKEQGRFDISKFLMDVNGGNPEGFMRRLQALLATVPHEQAFYAEATYQNIIFLLFTLLKRDVHTECHNNHGETDLVVCTERYAYVFEFKFNRSVSKAMEQINSRKYDAPYATDGRKVFKIAVNFSSKRRNIENWEIRDSN